jgi:hypothetical protein
MVETHAPDVGDCLSEAASEDAQVEAVGEVVRVMSGGTPNNDIDLSAFESCTGRSLLTAVSEAAAGLFPDKEAPDRFVLATLPGSREAMKSLLESLPVSVAGKTKEPVIEQPDGTGFLVFYGAEREMAVQASDSTSSAAGPHGSTPGGMLGALALSLDPDSSSAGTRGGVLWVHREKSSDEPASTAIFWADDSSPWVLGAITRDAEDLAVMVAALTAGRAE